MWVVVVNSEDSGKDRVGVVSRVDESLREGWLEMNGVCWVGGGMGREREEKVIIYSTYVVL